MSSELTEGRFVAGQTTALTEIQDDGITPTLDTLRRPPSISNTVAHLKRQPELPYKVDIIENLADTIPQM